MTQFQGGPAYGGTPSDSAVLAAIADLKARGLKVTLYPFVLMDIAQANTLTDPYTGTSGQAAYPWRGRITCTPAPDESGSPDQTGSLTAQTDSFVGNAVVANFQAGNFTVNYTGGTDWGYRRMILHYARLSAMAGGVDAFLIGSELRGLTWLRDSQTSFPFVNDLIDLAGDVRSIVGSATKLTYAADWSEYSGLQPPDASGDKLFHLDPLWADADIDAIGIDNYMPLSDWRGSGTEPDADIGDYPQQMAYLSANIAGGEGFDWYYASDADRIAGTRTPITDTLHSEPWVWRYKDLTSWWSNAHHNRVNGVRDTGPTNWMPQSKPIWFTELGCGAVDKGPNSPNLFGDPKSSENATPPFSDGSPDPLVQRQFLRAHHQWWQPGGTGFDNANNPASAQYSGRMVDPDRLFIWTWDARPYPAFPTRTEVWSDGSNYENGHWLTGRLGALSSDELLSGMADDYGVSFATVSAAGPLVHGAQISNVTSLRNAVEPLLDATGLIVRDTAAGLTIMHPAEVTDIGISSEILAAGNTALLKRQSSNHDETIGQLALSYIDRTKDYQTASVTAISSLHPVQTGVATNLILDDSKARKAAETILNQRQLSDSLEFGLPLSLQALEIGDRLELEGVRDGPFRISQIRVSDDLKISARAEVNSITASFGSDIKAVAASVPQIASLPEIVVAHLLGEGGEIDGTELILGAFADPWPGEIRIVNDTNSRELARLTSRVTVGELTTEFQPASTQLWDRREEINLELFGGHLASATEIETLTGANRLAIVNDDGNWEVVGFSSAELVSPNIYRLTNLLRGLQGTKEATQHSSSIGNRVLLLDQTITTSSVSTSDLETNISLRAFAGSYDLIGQSFSQLLSIDLAQPMAPANLSARKATGSNDIQLEWKRRTQIGGDSWTGANVPLDFSPEHYAVMIYDGSTMVRQEAVSSSALTYTSAQQMADFGATLSTFTFTIQQVSTALGPGRAATGAFDG